jgi:hypothetical protein
MLSKFMIIVWLGYNYEQPVLIGHVENCDNGMKIAEQLHPDHKAYACFSEEHWDKNKWFILQW